MNRTHWALVLLAAGMAAALLDAQPGQSPAQTAYPFAFRDVTREVGLLPDVGGMQGHAAAWGDVDGDGWIDLYVGAFHKPDGKSNQFFRNHQGKFKLDEQPALRVSARSSGAVFADFDNKGQLDFYLSNLGGGTGTFATPNFLFRNDGKGKFTDVSKASNACPEPFRGRSACVLDFDGDGLLDLLVGESILYGSQKRSRLFRNKGGLVFEDVSDAAGLPAGVPGLSVAGGDVNNDGWPDIILVAAEGSNRLFLNDGKGKFREAHEASKVFNAAWSYKGDNTTCGVCLGDVNRDGLLDVVIGQHYKQPWLQPVAVRLYLNRGVKDGSPSFEDVTDKVGLKPLPMKGPHVELQDFDNDGWPDLYVSIVKFAGGKSYPVIFKNLGVKDGLPQFREDALAVNDFPSKEDQAIKKTGDFFNKMIKDHKIIYMAAAPSGDYDNDGRIDLFLASWWVESPSLLLRNETKGGNWLQVQVEGTKGVNRMGVGTRVKIYPAGKCGDAAALLGCQDISAGYGYSSGQAALAHFGLGRLDSVDLEVTLPCGKGTLTQKGVRANQRLTVKQTN
jgi:hypothetical protein